MLAVLWTAKKGLPPAALWQILFGLGVSTEVDIGLWLSPQSDWDVVERGWKAHVLGEAEHTLKDPVEAIQQLRVRSTCPHPTMCCSLLPQLEL